MARGNRTISTPHAIVRLRERFGVEISLRQLNAIADHLGDPRKRPASKAFRFVGRNQDGTTIWLVNLKAVAGAAIWAPFVFDPGSRRVVTVLPPEANGCPATSGWSIEEAMAGALGGKRRWAEFRAASTKGDTR